MSIKKIVKVWSDKELINENINFLRRPTKNIFFPISTTTEQIIKDLIDTYKSIPCAGIAANQIGYDKSIFIGLKYLDENIDEEEIEKKESQADQSDIDGNEYADNYEIYINPQIDRTDKKSIQEEIEGCLSFPNISLKIKRFDNIKVRYYNKDGKSIRKTLNGFMSKLFQHELDHLNGKLMMEHNLIEGYIDEKSDLNPELFLELKQKLS